MSRGKKVLVTIAAVVAALVALWVVAGAVRVPMRFDAEGVTSLQLNGGTMTLTDAAEPGLRASVPLRVVPVLMARRTDGLLEVGGFDDSDPRILVAFLMPLARVPLGVDAVRWELSAPELEQITLAGGRLEADSYSADELLMLGINGSANLRDVEIGTLAIHAQAPARLSVTGHAGTLSVMNSGGTIDTDGLEYDAYDKQVIVDYFEE